MKIGFETREKQERRAELIPHEPQIKTRHLNRRNVRAVKGDNGAPRAVIHERIRVEHGDGGVLESVEHEVGDLANDHARIPVPGECRYKRKARRNGAETGQGLDEGIG